MKKNKLKKELKRYKKLYYATPLSATALIRNSCQKYKKEIAENITANNTLLLRLTTKTRVEEDHF